MVTGTHRLAWQASLTRDQENDLVSHVDRGGDLDLGPADFCPLHGDLRHRRPCLERQKQQLNVEAPPLRTVETPALEQAKKYAFLSFRHVALSAPSRTHVWRGAPSRKLLKTSHRQALSHPETQVAEQLSRCRSREELEAALRVSDLPPCREPDEEVEAPHHRIASHRALREGLLLQVRA